MRPLPSHNPQTTRTHRGRCAGCGGERRPHRPASAAERPAAERLQQLLAAAFGRGRQCLEALTRSYLGDWITRQQDSLAHGEPGAEGHLAAALELKVRLSAIAEGEPPHDLFIRWKPLHEQPLGWQPGPNDAVRLNVRPFMANDLPSGKKAAGILRTKPNIHWRKDRGKEPIKEEKLFPWFWIDSKLTGERVDDRHFSLALKQAGRTTNGDNRDE